MLLAVLARRSPPPFIILTPPSLSLCGGTGGGGWSPPWCGGGCGNCHDRIQEIIDTHTGIQRMEIKVTPRLTNIQKIKLIEETLEREIKPGLKKDGGDIDLIDVDGEYGRVETITLRSTRLVTVDGRMLAIPNAKMANEKVASAR